MLLHLSKRILLFKTKVSLDRIATYLDEDEVTDQVCSLKKSHSSPQASPNDEGLGIDNGSFQWNAVQEKKADEGKTKAQKKVSSASSADTIVELPSETNEESADHQFELKDISVRFPDGKLTCITGPTASGKTAMLVRFLSLRYWRR